MAPVISLDDARRARRSGLAGVPVPRPASQAWREAIGYFTSRGRTVAEACQILAPWPASTQQDRAVSP